MVKHYVVHMDLEGPHAPDLSGHVQELIDAGYVVMRADIIETSCGSPVSSPLSALTAAQEFALAAEASRIAEEKEAVKEVPQAAAAVKKPDGFGDL